MSTSPNIILYSFNGIFMLANSMLGPLYGLYINQFSDPALTASISWAAYLIAATITTLIMRQIGDRNQETEYFLILGYIFRAVSWAIFPFVASLQLIVILQIIIGIGDGLGAPAFDALHAAHLHKGKHLADFANWKLISSLVMAVGTLAGGFIVSRFGFNILFFIMSSLAFFSAIGVYFQPRKRL
jgi:MFS family permease